MGKLNKIILFFVLIISFGFSLCVLSLFYPIPYIYDTVAHFQGIYPWLNYVLAGYCSVVSLCLLLILLVVLFSSSEPHFLVISKEKGRLQFSKRTVESTIRYSFAGLQGIYSSKIKVRINKKPEKTKVLINLSVNDTTQLAALTENLQEKIAATVQSSLGIGIKAITVKVNKFKSDDAATGVASTVGTAATDTGTIGTELGTAETDTITIDTSKLGAPMPGSIKESGEEV